MLAALTGGTYGLSAFVLQDIENASMQDGLQKGSVASWAAASGSQSNELAGLSALADFVAPTGTLTPTPTSSPTPSPSPEASPTPTEVLPGATEEALETSLVEANAPPTEAAAAPTETPAPPTATLEPPTATAEPPTATPEPPTPTPEPPTATPEPPTATPTLAIPENVPLLGDYVPPPTATPAPTATNTPSQGPDPGRGTDGLVAGQVTRYADSLEGNQMACGGTFDQDIPYVIAVGFEYDITWPCGTPLEVCGPAGCIVGTRTDTCPGCSGAHIDMSRTGVQAVCGNQTGCDVVIRRAR